LDFVDERQIRVDGAPDRVRVAELVRDAMALAPDRGHELLPRDQALDLVAELELVRRVRLGARRARVELAPYQRQHLVGRHDEALLDGAVARPRVAVRLALHEDELRLARPVPAEAQRDGARRFGEAAVVELERGRVEVDRVDELRVWHDAVALPAAQQHRQVLADF
jgi:hypothetical protein